MNRTKCIVLAGAVLSIGLIFLSKEMRLLLPPWYGGRPALCWLKQLGEEDEFARQQAAHALGRIGPRAEPAIPNLILALKSAKPWGKSSPGMGATVMDPVPEAAREAIIKIGPRATPALTSALNDPDPLVRVNAAWALWHLQRDQQVVLPIFVAALRDKEAAVLDRTVRMNASKALGEVGRCHPESVLPVLLTALTDDDDEVVCAAVASLALMGQQVGEAVRVIVGVLQHQRAGPRNFAMWRLQDLDSLAIPFLITALKDNNPQLRAGAAMTLGTMQCIGTNALSALLNAKNDMNSEVRYWVSWAIDRQTGAP